MAKIRRKLNSLLVLVITCVLLGNTTAFAAGGCSLRVIVQNDEDEPVPNINVELYSVAREENGAYALTSDFSDLGITAQMLHDDPSPKNAEKVSQYAYAKELDGTIKRTSASGIVDFFSLEKGIYLVLDRGEQAVAFEPYLVILPSEIKGNLESNVISIPKTSATETRTLAVFKLWDDNMDAAGKRPSNLEVTVFRDSTPVRKVTLNEANSWQHIFYMLPNDGTYTVQEAPVTDYQAEYVPVAEGYLIINSYTGGSGGGGGGGGGGGEVPEPEPQKAHVSVTKVWDDNDDAAGKRPSSITVQLIENNTVIKTAPLSSANNWKHTFIGLDPEKSYTVQEIAVSEYSASYIGNAATGIIITNTYTETTDPGIPPTPIIPEPETINIPVKVEWIDNDDIEGKRPDMVTVHLIADGSIIATLQLHPGNNWESVFAGVPADLSYTVWQVGVEEYTTTYSGDAATGFVVTNTYTPGTTDPGIPPDPTIPVEPSEPVEPPQEPVGPTIPQTGAEVLPVYLLMAAGVLLVFLGIVDLYRGREDT